MFLTPNKSYQWIYNIGALNLVCPKWDFIGNSRNAQKTHILTILMIIYYIIVVIVNYTYLCINSYQTITVSGKYGDFLVIIEDTLIPSFACLIMCRSFNKKWYSLFKLIDVNQTVASTDRFCRNPLILQFIIAHVTYVFTIILVQWLYFKDSNESDDVAFLYVTIFGYILIMYIYCIFTCVVFGILTTVKNSFSGIRSKRYFKMRNPSVLKLIRGEYSRALQSCDVFNELFGVILLVYGLFVCIQLLTGINGAINVALNDETNWAPFIGTVFMGLMSLVIHF